MAHNTTPNWLGNFRERIKKRDVTDVIPFKQLIMACMQLIALGCLIGFEDSEAVHREEALLDDMDSMREHQSTLDEHLRASNIELEAYKRYKIRFLR
jgi:hypothetical protein